MADETRVVLVKPGDVLIFGNVGDARPDEVSALCQQLKEQMGLGSVIVFAEDIDLSALAFPQMWITGIDPDDLDGEQALREWRPGPILANDGP